MGVLSKKVAKADEKICVACGSCIKACPKTAISIPNGCFAVVNAPICVGCGKCAKVCPADCIVVKERSEL